MLLGASLKFEGRFQLQTKSDGAIEMIVVDFDAPDRLRATARFDAGKIAALGPGARKTAELLGQGILAMTIDQGSERSRYQGVVALEGQGFEEAAHQYFRQSEQIPTRVRLAVAEEFSAGRRAWRAGGLMVQFLPASPERMRQADLPPGDIPEGHPSREAPPAAGEDDAWVEAKALVDTTEDHELVDPELASERLLYRLFHERGVRVFEPLSIHEECRCSRERIMSMMRRFSRRTAATWSATTAASASPASSARACTTSTRPRSRPRWRSPRPHRLKRRGFVAGVAHLRPGNRA